MSTDFDEIREMLKLLVISQNRTDAQISKLEMAQEKTDAQISKLEMAQEKTDAQLAKTIKKLDAIGVLMGELGHSNGEYAESLFYDSLADKKTLGGIKYEVISKNANRRRHRTEDEYDILLQNGSAVGIIEVKYKVQKGHIEKLLSKKQENFRILFPEFNNFKLYMGIAGFSFEPETESFAADNGLVVLKQKGDVIQVNSSQMRAF
jgi:hypothetical protein